MREHVEIQPSIAVKVDYGYGCAEGSDLRHDGIKPGIQAGFLMREPDPSLLGDFL